MDIVKENLPAMADDGHPAAIMSVKKQASVQTPRQPLMDLKQIGRPVTVDGAISKMSDKSKCHTPLCTPKMKKTTRKIQPSSLVYVEGEDKPESKEGSSAKPEALEADLGCIPEEGLNEFVTQVIDKCVRDIQSQIAETNPTRIHDNLEDKAIEISGDEAKPFPENLECLSESAKETVEATNHADLEDAEEEFKSCVEDTETVSAHDATMDLSISEDNLLGDMSQYTDCSESFTESTKTEDELLASFSDCSKLADKSLNGSRHDSETDTSSAGFDHVHRKEQTPRPTFLEKVALTHRVREAVSSVASWVVPQEEMEWHLQKETVVGKARLVHDVACSPIVFTDPSAQTVVKSNEKDYASANEIVEESDLEKDVKIVTENVISKILKEEEMEECVSSSNHATKNTDSELVVASESTVSAGCTSTPVKVTVSCADTAGTKSAGCSPMPVSVNEAGVQSVVVEYQSVMCSPISVPVCNSSTQHELEMQSVMCSPIPASVCDVSVQHELQTQTAMCSPMVIPVCDVSIQQEMETQSVMCSPMKIPVLDTSVQNVAETQSTMCSPMVPRPSQDKSVLVSGPDLVDSGVGTDQVLLQDVGITVAPETVTVATEMDDLPMRNHGTSMTPIKLGKRQDRKLTAEDVRKQHPRVVANQLDTLMVENKRLDGLIRTMEKRAKKLVAHEEVVRELGEVKLAHAELQEMHDKEMADWRHRCDKLEAEMAVERLQHQTEIINLKDEYESTDYLDFLASQKLVSELQAGLEQYTTLGDDIDQSHKVQVEQKDMMGQSWSKLRTASEKIGAMKHKLDEQMTQLKKQKAENSEESAHLEEQKATIQAQRQEIAEMVTVYKENMVELETKMEKTSEDLQVAQDRIASLVSELEITKKDLEDQTGTNSTLSNDLEQSKLTEEKLSQEANQLQTQLTQKTEELQGVSKRLTEAQEAGVKEAEEYKKAERALNLAIVNLERTLEMREADLDGQERELFECREIIYTQMETAKAAETQEKASTEELATLRRENTELRDCCAVLRGKEQELRATLESVQEELQGTRDHATRFIKQQGTEISDCYTALAQLTEGMTAVLGNLNQRAGIQKVGLNSSLGSAMDELTQLGNSSHFALPTHTTKGNQNSLVSQILHAAKSVETTIDAATTSKDSSQTGFSEEQSASVKSAEDKSENNAQNQSTLQEVDSFKKLGHDENSEVTPVQSVTQSETENQSNATNSVDKSSAPEQLSKSLNVGQVEGVGRWGVGGGEGENCLVPQVERMSSLFNEIMRVAHLLERALKSSLNDVRTENDDLNCRMFQCEYAERRLHAELELRQSELTKSRAAVKQLQSQLDEMGERLGQVFDSQSEVKQQQLEIRSLRGKVQALEGEKELLEEQIAELLQQIDARAAGDGQTDEVGTARKEILKLQKKVERYRAQQRENDSRMEELSTKAARRIQKLEDNWKKADSEVCRLDDLVDIIRKELVGSEILRRDTRLQKLVNMIDGVESLSGSRNKSGELKPVKTARW